MRFIMQNSEPLIVNINGNESSTSCRQPKMLNLLYRKQVQAENVIYSVNNVQIDKLLH